MIGPISDKEWQAQRDLETLIECEKIEKDPKRLAAAKKIAKQRLEDFKSIQGESAKD